MSIRRAHIVVPDSPLRARVALSAIQQYERRQMGQAVPSPADVEVTINSAVGMTCISQEVADHLGLVPDCKIMVSGLKEGCVYGETSASLQFSGGCNWEPENWAIVIDPQLANHLMVLGKDVLEWAHLTYDGATGAVQLVVTLDHVAAPGV